MQATKELVLRMGEGPDDPALWRLCGLPLVLRLALAARRSGIRRVVLTGGDAVVGRAAELLRADDRLAGSEVREGEGPAHVGPRIEMPANVLVPVEVMRRLAEAEGDVHLPDVPEVTKRVPGGDGASQPLWQGAAPDRCFAIPVRERRDLAHAKRILFRHVKSTSSSPIARWVNERISVHISKLLVETPITPNQATVFNTALGVAGAVITAFGDVLSLAIGGVLLQATSVLDCCDGEIARCKFMESEYGAWIDTVGDNVTYAAYALGLTVGYARFAHVQGAPWAPYVAPVGLGALALAMLLIGGMFHYARAQRLGGSMTAISKHFEATVDRRGAGVLYKILDFLKVMGRRAQFTLAFAVVAVLPLATGSAAFYHGIFFAMIGFVLLANAYFGVGILKARRALRARA
ncbi:MAG: CDP-alcohol phosphatidyltransferase family protein [Myxococcota bacterium]